jgi:hypothetical protein
MTAGALRITLVVDQVIETCSKKKRIIEEMGGLMKIPVGRGKG